MPLTFTEQQQVIDIVRQAGKAALTYWRRHDLKSEIKSDGSDLTEADMASNDVFMGELPKILPDYAILTEETVPDFLKKYSQIPTKAFIIDPIDGTTDFKNGLDNWIVLLAVVENHQLVFGVKYFPVLDLMYYTAKGQGVWRIDHGGAPDRVYFPEKSPNDRTFKYYSNPYGTDPGVFAAIDDVARQFGLEPVHLTIPECYQVHDLFTGACDLEMECANREKRQRNASGGLWDVAADGILVQEAGGIMTDGFGNPFDYTQPDYKLYHKLCARPLPEGMLARIQQVIRPCVEMGSIITPSAPAP